MVAATGRYKMFPIGGLISAMVAFITLAWAAINGGSQAVIETSLVLLGAGLGFVMPNLTVAIQNAVDRADLGAATSVSAFLRSLGGALGVAVAGAVMAFRLRTLLPASWTHAGASGTSPLEMGFQEMARLPIAQREVLVHAYRHAIGTTFLTGAAIAGAAFAVVLFLPERPLRERKAETPKPEEAREPAAY
jgi:hypothetical protein